MNPANQAPAITSGRTGVHSGHRRELHGNDDGDADAFSITQTGTLPSGVTFTSNSNGTATLSGTPGAGTNGSYPLTITASNGVGTNATQSFTLTVNPGARHSERRRHQDIRGGDAQGASW